MEIPDLDADTVVASVAAVGSANWALIEWADFDIMAEFFAGSPEIGAAAFGVAGLVSITERFGFTELFD